MFSKAIKSFIFLLTALWLFCPGFALAKETYPKLANYYLNFFDRSKYEELYKWDLLIVQPEMVFLNDDFFVEYKKRKADGLLISYVYPAMVTDYNPDKSINLRSHLFDNVDNNSWWLSDANKKRLEIWPGIYAVNVCIDGWQSLNINYLRNMINLDKWDGIMYDTVDATIERYNLNGGIDIDADGLTDKNDVVNKKWQEGMALLFKNTRNELKNKIILINGNSLDSYQPDINGRMFESFPAHWEGNGSWEATISAYLKKLPKKNIKPQVYVINGNTGNTGQVSDYRKMRFGLTSTLLGDGYYSFDHGDQDHGQTWWYDEFDIKLGQAQSDAYNLLQKSDKEIKPGLWRRDFENGISLVNSTGETKKYVFLNEEFEKIKGAQDKKINDGSKINWIKLKPMDGVVLLKINTEINNSGYKNGSFVRSFDQRGQQVKNGFFAYKDVYPGNTQILVSDLDNDGEKETLVNGSGAISIYKKGVKVFKFLPYGANYKGAVSFAVGDLNGDKIKEIITGPGSGSGGGPHIKIFSSTGKILSAGFFAFDKNTAGGISLAVGDINNDCKDEIIVGSGSGNAPVVRIFNSDGKKINEFTAYDKNFKGGVSVAIGDINNDGRAEIVTGPGAGGNPNVKVFTKEGKATNQFFAYDKSIKTGIQVMTDDINKDGLAEILVSTTNYIK